MAVQKPLKYFEIYTQEPDEDARAGISHSSSKLQLVPKGAQHASRRSERLRSRSSKSRSHTGNGIKKDHASTSSLIIAPVRLTEATLAQHAALLPVEDPLPPPPAKKQEPVRVPLAATSYTATEEPRTFGSRYANSNTQLPARLAVPPPFDIFAGPRSPVSADSMTNLAVSDTQMDTKMSSIAVTQSHNNLPQDQCTNLERVTTTASSSACSNQPKVDQAGLAGHSKMDPLFESTTTISQITAKCFAKHESVSCLPQATVIPSIDDIIQQHRVVDVPLRSGVSTSSPPVPAIPAKFRTNSQRILSIDEIVRRHPAAQVPIRKAGQSAAPVLTTSTRSRTITEDSEVSQSRSSIDSITGEIMQSIQHQGAARPALHHTRSQPSFSTPSPTRYRERTGSTFGDSPSESPSYASPLSCSESRPFCGMPTTDEEITQYIRSARLTRLMTLRRPPNHHLVVSLADVGCKDGHPIVVFLGLGSVRYLVALYDELAESLGLRLICIDRWGLGKTGDVPDSRRGFREWSTIVEEVLDQLGVNKFSIIAHSAGAPYALASSIRLEARVHGSIQLLAPWVGSASESTASAYKWLKFVPSGVIKTAQAAEWKVQGWRLGKNPKFQAQGVGFDPRAPLSSESTASSPIFADFAATLTLFDESSAAGSRSRTASPSLVSESELDTSFGEEEPSTSFVSTPTQTRTQKISGAVGRPQPHLRLDTMSPRLTRKVSTSSRNTSIASPSIRSQLSTPKPATKLELGTALMRASHAESLKGGTSDLLAILQKTSKAPDFAYSDVTRPVRVWHGLKDDKISLQNVLTLETLIPDCKVNVIPGADHSLMTNVAVFVQVLQSLAGEWDVSSRL